ncbi:MAG: GGDEF domain-containing protein, partial [Thermodesulfobacteriota bacterium]|nr:GGDEF domain-containing protein [Thermodesulfobacteriota bacterium]
LFFEYKGLLPPINNPFSNYHISKSNFTDVINTFLWVTLVNIMVAFLVTIMITAIRKKGEKLQRMVIRDGLTGLFNRSYFYRMLNSEIERCKRYNRVVSVMMIDLDNFKYYNDTYGHIEGDKVLKLVGQIFSKNIRSSKERPEYNVDIACRYGGDEFSIVLPETASYPDANQKDGESKEHATTEGALMLAERLRFHVEKGNLGKLGITICIGVATYPFHGKTSDELVKNADTALYRAKSLGQNKVVSAGDL